VDKYSIQLFLHVGAVIVALGPVFALPFLQAYAQRDGVGSTRFMLQFSERIYHILVVPGAVIVLIFGLALVVGNERGYREDFPLWLGITAFWYIIALALSVHYQPAAERKAMEILDDLPGDAALPEAYAPLGKRLQVIEGFLALTTLAVTFVMFWKPGE